MKPSNLLRCSLFGHVTPNPWRGAKPFTFLGITFGDDLNKRVAQCERCGNWVDPNTDKIYKGVLVASKDDRIIYRR